MRQENMVLGHLERHGSITSLEAFELYHITRLAAVIHRIRKHTDVKTIILHGYDSGGNYYQYARYEIEKPHGTTNTARLEEGERFEDIFPSEDIT